VAPTDDATNSNSNGNTDFIDIHPIWFFLNSSRSSSAEDLLSVQENSAIQRIISSVPIFFALKPRRSVARVRMAIVKVSDVVRFS